MWVFENVPGFMRLYKGHFYREFVKKVEQMGYHLATGILDASEYGVPQKRKRLVFVGIKDVNFNFSDIIATHGPGLIPYVSVREAIGDLPSLSSKESASRYNKPASCEYQKLMRSKSSKFDCHIAPNHPTSTIEKIKSL